jgi:hypothetical protein
VNVIKLLTDDVNSNDFKAQVIRDLLLLMPEWDLVVSASSNVPQDIIYGLGLALVEEKAGLSLVYRTKADGDYPEGGEGKVVKRDLTLVPSQGGLSVGDHPGYYLKPQGRFGPSFTQQYLNRAYPKGRGVSNMLLKLTWG